MFPVTKVRIPSSRVMVQQHHRQVSEGYNHCAMLSEKSPTVSREAYIQEKKKSWYWKDENDMLAHNSACRNS